MLLNLLNLKTSAFGLDISDLSLKLVCIEGKHNTKKIVSFGKLDIPAGIIKRGQIKDPQELAKQIKKLIKGVKGKKVTTPYVVASLPEEKTFSQVIALPKMTEEEAKQAIYFEAEKYIPYSVDKVYLDCQKISIEHGDKDKTYVLLVALPKNTADRCAKALDLAGLRPLALEIESQATVRAVLDEEKKRSPAMLIMDIGATRTGFIIFSGTALRFTTSIPVSSGDFTRIIAKVFKIDYKSADELKIQYGLSQKTKEGKKVFEALIPALTDLTEQIKKYIEYYHSRAEQDPGFVNGIRIEKILLCGGGAKLIGLPEFLSEQLGLLVEIANPLVNLKGETKMTKDQALEYTTAIGLALRAIKENGVY